MIKRISIGIAAVALALAGAFVPGMYHHSGPTADPAPSPTPLMHYHG